MKIKQIIEARPGYVLLTDLGDQTGSESEEFFIEESVANTHVSLPIVMWALVECPARVPGQPDVSVLLPVVMVGGTLRVRRQMPNEFIGFRR
jgi:hypothetical protein